MEWTQAKSYYDGYSSIDRFNSIVFIHNYLWTWSIAIFSSLILPILFIFAPTSLHTTRTSNFLIICIVCLSNMCSLYVHAYMINDEGELNLSYHTCRFIVYISTFSKPIGLYLTLLFSIERLFTKILSKFLVRFIYYRQLCQQLYRLLIFLGIIIILSTRLFQVLNIIIRNQSIINQTSNDDSDTYEDMDDQDVNATNRIVAFKCCFISMNIDNYARFLSFYINKMITTLETIPNEILLMIFSHLSWFELLMSLSSLNKRFDRLICSILSKIDNKSNNGLVIINPGLSYNKCNSILLPLISNPLLPFASCIRRIHFDGTICNDSDLSYKWLFDNDKKILHFPNLKSLILTRCLLVQPLIKSLPILIKYQLDELILTFDKDIITLLRYPNGLSAMDLRTEKLIMLEELIRKLFSNQSRLISLQLDIACDDSYANLHRCLEPHITLAFFSIFTRRPSCLTLRRLYIHIKYTCFLERLIEYVPVLQQLSCHTLYETNKAIWKSVIDANFIQRYCLPDEVINLRNFDFYIFSKCNVPMIDIEEIINSFKIHPFFVDHQWTNIKCFFDSITSYQHLTSSLNYTPRFSNNLM
ncbi:unnamed protein product [Rotaria sp. Silwood1]|nr:unnamed protein product [Rotaria sp. Silwood1]